jgi:hypothetical protein
LNYIQVGLSLKDDPRVYPSGLDGFGIVITLGLLAAEKYGANGIVAPPFSSAIHVARHANTDPDRAMAALTSLKAHGAISGSQDEGWTLAEDLWTMFAGRAIAERDRKRAQREGKKDDAPTPPTRRSSRGQRPKSAPRRVTKRDVPGTEQDVPGPDGDTRPTIQPTTHPTNRHNNVGCLDVVHGGTATPTEGHAEGEPPPCARCGYSCGGLLYRVLDGESWDNPSPHAWECACCPDCTTEGSLTKANVPKVGLVPLPDAEGEDWRRAEETPLGPKDERKLADWANEVRKITRARIAPKG